MMVVMVTVTVKCNYRARALMMMVMMTSMMTTYSDGAYSGDAYSGDEMSIVVQYMTPVYVATYRQKGRFSAHY
jgi:hypothetical protein